MNIYSNMIAELESLHIQPQHKFLLADIAGTVLVAVSVLPKLHYDPQRNSMSIRLSEGASIVRQSIFQSFSRALIYCI